jgi:hypothetical protein
MRQGDERRRVKERGDEIIKKNKLAQYKVGGGNCDDKNKSDFQKWRRGTRL